MLHTISVILNLIENGAVEISGNDSELEETKTYTKENIYVKITTLCDGGCDNILFSFKYF